MMGVIQTDAMMPHSRHPSQHTCPTRIRAHTHRHTYTHTHTLSLSLSHTHTNTHTHTGGDGEEQEPRVDRGGDCQDGRQLRPGREGEMRLLGWERECGVGGPGGMLNCGVWLRVDRPAKTSLVQGDARSFVSSHKPFTANSPNAHTHATQNKNLFKRAQSGDPAAVEALQDAFASQQYPGKL
jgi:hypothetical protein